jgi:hypothetical protein
MAEAVEHLHCKHEALSSDPRLTKSKTKQIITCWAWWCTPVVPALGRLRQEVPLSLGIENQPREHTESEISQSVNQSTDVKQNKNNYYFYKLENFNEYIF